MDCFLIFGEDGVERGSFFFLEDFEFLNFFHIPGHTFLRAFLSVSTSLLALVEETGLHVSLPLRVSGLRPCCVALPSFPNNDQPFPTSVGEGVLGNVNTKPARVAGMSITGAEKLAQGDFG